MLFLLTFIIAIIALAIDSKTHLNDLLKLIDQYF